MKHHCREVLQRAYLFLDGEGLTEDERVEIRVHLEECAPCYERVGIEKEVFRIVGRLSSTHQCPEQLRQRITARLDEL